LLALINPALDETRGRDIAVAITHLVRKAKERRQLAILTVTD